MRRGYVFYSAILTVFSKSKYSNFVSNLFQHGFKPQIYVNIDNKAKAIAIKARICAFVLLSNSFHHFIGFFTSNHYSKAQLLLLFYHNHSFESHIAEIKTNNQNMHYPRLFSSHNTDNIQSSFLAS